jgi:hypothetical protein
VLFIDAFIARRRQPMNVFAVGLAFGAVVAPFLFFYELAGRLSVQYASWSRRFAENAFYLDRYLAPIIVLAAATVFLGMRWRRTAEAERRLVAISLAILGALLFWVPTVAPGAIHRYVVMATPLGCLAVAWFFSRALTARRGAAAWLAAAFVALSPVLSKPLETQAPTPQLEAGGAWVRPELGSMFKEIFVARKDPNRMLVEWIRENTSPADEILVNYEDLPLMYYLPNPIRGGVSAFRVSDPAGPPAIAVLRRSVLFVHWPVFLREYKSHQWDELSHGIPDVVWGNNPDPIGKIQDPDTIRSLLLARRR